MKRSPMSIFSESAPQIRALDRNLSAFSTLFTPGKSWDNARSTAAPYTESRLARLVRNKHVGFPVVEQVIHATKRQLKAKLWQGQRKRQAKENREIFINLGCVK
jgi:hypothetical protein